MLFAVLFVIAVISTGIVIMCYEEYVVSVESEITNIIGWTDNDMELQCYDSLLVKSVNATCGCDQEDCQQVTVSKAKNEDVNVTSFKLDNINLYNKIHETTIHNDIIAMDYYDGDAPYYSAVVGSVTYIIELIILDVQDSCPLELFAFTNNTYINNFINNKKDYQIYKRSGCLNENKTYPVEFPLEERFMFVALSVKKGIRYSVNATAVLYKYALPSHVENRTLDEMVTSFEISNSITSHTKWCMYGRANLQKDCGITLTAYPVSPNLCFIIAVTVATAVSITIVICMIIVVLYKCKCKCCKRQRVSYIRLQS